jgi:PPOX class probable F420-dependent enzyme
VSAADLDLVRRLSAADQGLAIVATARADATVQASLVNAGVIADPDAGTDAVAFVARGGTVKLRNLRERPRATVVFRAGWEWVSVEGAVRIVGPDDTDPEQLRVLLRDVFTAAGGTHDDWDTYDRVMREDGRVAVFVTPERITSN